jgi:hypothetical protein
MGEEVGTMLLEFKGEQTKKFDEKEREKNEKGKGKKVSIKKK